MSLLQSQQQITERVKELRAEQGLHSALAQARREYRLSQLARLRGRLMYSGDHVTAEVVDAMLELMQIEAEWEAR